MLNKTSPKSVQLAVTAALEHYTATLAEVILTDESVRDDFLTDEVRTLFTWHALEETEHKSVAFDVFQHVSGNNAVRVGVMAAVHIEFFLAMTAAVSFSILRDRDVPKPRVAWRRASGVCARHPFFSRRMVRRLLDYNRRDFHPDDHDTDALLAQWRTWWDAQAAA